MKSLIRLAVFGGLFSVTSVAGPALAQVTSSAPLAVGGKADTAANADRTRRAAESVQAMRGSLRQVTARVEDARNEKDVVKLNCVNEKLAQIKGLLKVAEQSENALKEAMATNDPSANVEFAKIGIAKGKVDGLSGDAQQCIGQLAYIVDEKTTVEVQQPSNQPERETSGRYRPTPPPSAPVVLRPKSASTVW
jgi:TolA-binding protein